MTIQLSTVQPDFEQLVAQLETALSAKDAWKDKLTTSTGQTLLELISADGTYSQFSISSALQESFPETARRDSSIYAAVRMLGVRIARKLPASCLVDLTRETYTASLTIPAYSVFTSTLGASLFNRDPIVFPAGTATLTDIPLYEGEVLSKTIRGIGQDFQVWLSSDTDFSVSDADTFVSVDNVEIPCVVDGLWHYKNSAPAVQDITTKKGELLLAFGNDNYGFKPIDNSVIFIQWVVTAGLNGNNAAFVNARVTFSTDATITGVPTTSLSGGMNQKPASTYRKISPQLFAADDKAVTPQDYKATAAKYSGVYDALVVGQRNLSITNNAYMNLIRVSLLTSDTWTNQQWNDFVTWYQAKTMFSGRFYRQDPLARVANVAATIYIDNTAVPDDVEAVVNAALTDLFSPRFGLISLNIYKSDIHHAIKGAHRGINYVELTAPTVDLYAETTAPLAPTLTSVAGTLGAGIYSYGVTALSVEGETKMVNVNNITLASTGGVQINWSAVPNAIGYNVYGRTTTSYLKLANNLSVLTWTDNGSVTPSGALPDLDTTGVHYLQLGTVTLSTQFTSRVL